MKKVLPLIISVLFATTLLFQTKDANACHAIALVNTGQTNSVAGGIQVRAASDSPTCGCAVYWLDVEVRCMGEPFDGAAFNPGYYGPLNTYPYYQSAQMNKNSCVVKDYPWVTIDFAPLCPGQTYQYRMRENHNGAVGPWTTAQTFTVPGSTPSLTATATASPDTICAGNCATISPTITGGCNLALNYSWSNGSTSQNITVCPASTTTYSVTITEDCSGFSTTASATVNVVQPASVGTASISSTSICDGDNVSLSLGSYTGDLQWQSAPSSTGPWSNTGNTTSSFTTGALSSDMCYRAAVTGCNGTVYSNVVCVTVNPIPTVSVNNATVCNGQTATLTATPSTTGGTYSWNTGQTANSISVTPSSTTTYSVTYTLNGCTSPSASGTVTVDPLPTFTISPTHESCDGANDGSAAISHTGGTSPFSYSWSDGQTSQTATGLAPGTYSVTVTDANGCTVTNSVTINAGPLITAGYTQSPNQCLTGNSFSFTNTGSTGAGISFTWDFGDGSGTSTNENPTYSYSAAGTYTVTQTVTNGTCTATQTSSVTVHPMPVVTASGTDISCNGGSDGSVSASVSNSPGPFSYSWSPGGQTTSTVTGLPAGIYSVTVTDQNTGCQGTASVTITEPTALTYTSSQNNVTCFGYTDGDATITPSGGTTPYSYSWNTSPIQTTQTATNLGAGTYTVTVTDANGCTVTETFTITEPAGMTITTSSDTANCDQTDGAAYVDNVTGGTPGYSYSWSTGGTGTSETGLAGGNYIVTVTDANGCSLNDTVTVPSTTTPTATASKTQDVSCFGLSDGAGTVNVTGGASPYSYSWDSSPIQNTQNLTNVPAGTYTVTVTDVNGCVDVSTITISQPTELVSSITGTVDPDCGGGTNGSATVGASGGAGSYSYQWNDPGNQTTQTASNLGAGSYQVIVTDANGCTDTSSVTLNNGANVTLAFTQINVSCNGGSDGSIDLTPSGGVSPYTYNWSNGATSEDLNGLAAGTYSVTVADANGCSAIDSVTITEPPLLTMQMDSSIDVSCNGGADGQAFATAAGGTTPYTYSWSDGQTTEDASGLAAGNYTVTVTDNNGCTAQASVTINEPTAVSLTTSTDNSYCSLPNGAAYVTASGGTPGYTYDWDDGTGTVGTSDTLDNVVSGNYTITVTDANGCIETATVTINNDPAGSVVISSTTDVGCNGDSTGAATASVSGAYPSYSYQWNDPNNQTTATANNLPAGSYTATVTDSLGCVMTATATINEPTLITVSMSGNPQTCYQSCDGDGTATPSGGTSPYTYQWDDPSAQTSQTATGLCAGTYHVTVTDANGCTVQDSIIITPVPQIIVDASASPASCGQSDGSASASVTSGGVGGFSYSWNTSPVQTTQTASNIPAGTYTVTVTDADGCTGTDTTTVSNLSGPTLTVDTVVNVSCNGGSDGYSTVSVDGGVSPYVYSWNDPGFQTSPTASNLPAGSYTVQVTDSNGCSVSTSITVAEPPALNLNMNSVDPTCFNYTDGSASVAVSGGTPPYSYSWSSGQTTDTITGLGSGTYTVSVTDSMGCIDTASVTLNNPAQITLNLTGNNVSCNGACDGSASVAVTNGVQPFSYQWDDPSAQTNDTAVALCADTFNVVLTDADGCTANSSVVITQPDSLIVTQDTVSPVSCNGGNDGYAGVNVTGGTGPYTYSWSPGGYGTQSVSGLSAGTYSVTVTDANGCTDNINITITEPTALSSTFNTTDVDCYGANTGSAVAIPSGGTTPYSYQWNDANLQQTDTAGNLVAGAYDVTITDANGCTYVISNITINEPPQLAVTTTTDTATCGQANGSATASVAGGTSPFSYSWDDPNNQTTALASNLAGGNYTVTVTDANGCVVTASANVLDAGSPTVTIDTVNGVTCQGLSDGSATASATGGTPGYSYSWNSSPTQTGTTATGLPGGSISVTVTDANGCIASTSATVPEPTSLAVVIPSSSVTHVTCNGGSDGAASVTGSGGTTPYSYSWNSSPVQTTQGASGLTAGNYIATVTDSNGCSNTDTVTINEPAPLVTTLTSLNNVSCNGGSDGYIDLTTTGGTQPYAYSWTPNISSGKTASGLTAGSYNVVITDANGCSTTYDTTITEPDQLALTMSNTSSTCGQGNGSASVAVTGGTTAYNYMWTDPNNQTTATASNLYAGTYTVQVTDANGCQATGSTTITDLPGPVIDSISVIDVSCYGLSDGKAQVNVNPGGNSPFTYQWNDPFGQTAQQAVGLAAGSYTVTVTDSNGCSTNATTIVNQPQPLRVILNANPDPICYGQFTQLSATGLGGTQNYSYNWAPLGFTGAGNHTVFPTTTTQYSVSILDANGCSSDTTATVTVRPPLQVNTTDTAICEGETADITANASGGTGVYQFDWDEINGTNTNPYGSGNPISVSPTDTTQYIVTVNDNPVCSDSIMDTVTVFVNPLPVSFLTAADTAGCAPLTVNLEVPTTSGPGSTFEWDFDNDGVIDQTSSNNTITHTYTEPTYPGSHDVWVNVTSDKGCEASVIKYNWITVYPNPVADFIYDPEQTSLMNPIINFTNQSMGASSYLWEFGDGLTDSVLNPTHEYADSGNYMVRLVAETEFGCTDTAIQVIRIDGDFILYTPTAFSPDGDGLNDEFFPKGIGIDPDNFTFKIFDRWGELIFESYNPSHKWNGIPSGKSRVAQTDVYVWMIETKDHNGNVQKYYGRVTLIK